eukprot:scaffold179_cov373-Pavlova_lutheri.AAC.6
MVLRRDVGVLDEVDPTYPRDAPNPSESSRDLSGPWIETIPRSVPWIDTSPSGPGGRASRSCGNDWVSGTISTISRGRAEEAHPQPRKNQGLRPRKA